jgi:cytochrome c553
MWRLLFTVMVIVAFSTPAYAQDKPAVSADRGSQSYMKYQCYSCHGTVGQGADRATGPKLAPNPFPYLAFELQVRQPRQDMPAYRKQFVSDEELADIYAYLLTIKPSPPAKDIPLLNFD